MVKYLTASILRCRASSCEQTNLPEHCDIFQCRKCTSPTDRLLCQLAALLVEDLSSTVWHTLAVRKLITTRGSTWVTLAGTGRSCSDTFASRRRSRLLHRSSSTATGMRGHLKYMRMAPCRWDLPHGSGLPQVRSRMDYILYCVQDS